MRAVYGSNDEGRRSVHSRRHLSWRARVALVSLVTTGVALVALLLKGSGVF